MKEEKKVCLIGFAKPSRDKAPWDDPSYEFWGCNEGYVLPFPKKDRWFQIHPYVSFSRQENTNDPNHFFWLQEEHDFPIYMQREFLFVPSSKSYPLDELEQLFGRRYFRSSFDYMIAMALAEGYTTIGIYGFEMASDTEYCLDPSMRILTKDLRWVEVGEVEEGDEIVAFDEYSPKNDKRRWHGARVEAIGRIMRPTVKITMSDGTELICSKEHRWLTGNTDKRDWKESKHLTPKYGRKGRGGTASKLLRVTDVWEQNTSFGAGYVAGMLDGEGSLSQKPKKECMESHTNVLAFGQRENEMLEYTLDVLNEHGFVVHHYGDHLSYKIGGGIREMMRCLGTFRPKRLIPKFNPDKLGVLTAKDTPEIVSIEDLGWREVVQFKTSTGTCVVEGFASHNSHQRPSAEYWIGVAEGMGVKIELPINSNLLRGSVYGFEDNSVGYRQQLELRKAILEKQQRDANDEFQRLNGATAALDKIRVHAMNHPEEPMDIGTAFNESQETMIKQGALLNTLNGAKMEVDNLIAIFNGHSGVKGIQEKEKEDNGKTKEDSKQRSRTTRKTK